MNRDPRNPFAREKCIMVFLQRIFSFYTEKKNQNPQFYCKYQCHFFNVHNLPLLWLIFECALNSHS